VTHKPQFLILAPFQTRGQLSKLINTSHSQQQAYISKLSLDLSQAGFAEAADFQQVGLAHLDELPDRFHLG
jgi:hypothetical protein